MEYDYLLKIIMIGNSGVGKSVLLQKFTDDTYTDNYITTIGVDFKIRSLIINGKSIKLQIWDTDGQERFRTIISSYYRGAHGIILVFDLTDRESFINLSYWINEIDDNCPTIRPYIKILVGTKCDLEDYICVDDTEAKIFARLNNMNYIKTSAKKNINVCKLFESLSETIINETKLSSNIESVNKKININNKFTKPIDFNSINKEIDFDNIEPKENKKNYYCC
jgi:Ras-related protein Rab-1A